MTLFIGTNFTVTTDQFDAAADAIQYIANNIRVTIGAGISVVSGSMDGVESLQNGSTLINNGNIFGGSVGANFLGDDATITNNSGRSITGGLHGVLVNGDDVAVTNHGTIIGHTNTGVAFGITNGNFVLSNDGDIYGQNQGVSVTSNVVGGRINNSGLIHSDDFGVLVATAPGLMTVIKNSAGGVIKGVDAAIFTTVDGRISLDNRGTIAGSIDLNAATGNVNDVVTNKGKITGDVRLGAGNDTFNGNGGKATEVFGEAGNDTLRGGNSGDRLDGGAGNDIITGRRGEDTLFGGPDTDRFDFNSIAETKVGGARDKLMDFSHSQGDRIDLRDIDAKTGVGGNQNFKFIGNSDFHDKKGELRYEDKGSKVIVQGDVNGDGKADFEILVKIGALFAGDFVL